MMITSCNVCQKSFKKDEDLHSHKRQTQKCSSCQYCGEVISGRSEIRSHMKRRHLYFGCNSCSRKFFLSSSRDTHERMKHSVALSWQDKNASSGKNSVTLNTKFLADLSSYGSLQNLLELRVRPDSENKKKRNSIVDSLVGFMHHNVKYRIKEVVKAGSSGKGTSIETKADIDLVVYINDYTTVAELQENMGVVLKKLHDHVLKDAKWADHVHFIRYTSHSIRFCLRKNADDEMVDVDLLPAIDLGRGNRTAIFDRMSRLSRHDQSFYSVSFAKDQVDFVDRVPDDVKNLIRLVKHWKRREDISIVSYCIELIVIKQWMGWGEPQKLDLQDSFKKVMGKLTQLSTMQITWPSRYNTSKYGQYPSPAVTDPANPFINTADRIHDIPGIERKAKELYDLL